MKEKAKKLAPRFFAILALVLGLLSPLTPAATAAGYELYNCADATDIDNALNSGFTEVKIVLTNDINLGDLSLDTVVGNTGFTIAENMDVVLDLNGHTISGARVTKNVSISIIYNKGILTLTDSHTDPADWGSLEIDSDIVGVNNTTGTYVINNYAGTVTFESGRYINHGGDADTPYVINNMPNSASTRDVTTTVNGGYLESTLNDVFRLYDGYQTSVNNTLNINGGTLIGQGRVGWVQSGAAYPNTDGNSTGYENPGNVTINITGGYLEARAASFTMGVINISQQKKTNDVYARVEVNVSGGTLYSRQANNDVYNYPTIAIAPFDMPAAAAMGLMPTYITITGGTFDADPWTKNVDAASAYAYNTPNNQLAAGNLKVHSGNFTYDPEPYVQGADTPVARYTPASGQVWHYVRDDYVSAGLAAAGDNNSAAGTDEFELLRGRYTVDASAVNNAVKSDVHMIVNQNAAITLASGGVLTNNGLLTNNGVFTIDRGTLINNTVVVNENEFYRLSGQANGSPGAVIRHGSAAVTDINSNTVFFVDAYNGVSAPVTGTGVANYYYEYVGNNHWAMFRLEVSNGTITAAPNNGVKTGIGSASCEYHSGDVITITAAPAPANSYFSHWEIEASDPAAASSIGNMNAAQTTYTKGLYGVKLTAVYKMTPTTTPSASAPATGDASPIMGYGLLLLLAGAAVLAVRKAKSREF